MTLHYSGFCSSCGWSKADSSTDGKLFIEVQGQAMTKVRRYLLPHSLHYRCTSQPYIRDRTNNRLIACRGARVIRKRTADPKFQIGLSMGKRIVGCFDPLRLTLHTSSVSTRLWKSCPAIEPQLTIDHTRRALAQEMALDNCDLGHKSFHTFQQSNHIGCHRLN